MEQKELYKEYKKMTSDMGHTQPQVADIIGQSLSSVKKFSGSLPRQMRYAIYVWNKVRQVGTKQIQMTGVCTANTLAEFLIANETYGSSQDVLFFDSEGFLVKTGAAFIESKKNGNLPVKAYRLVRIEQLNRL